MGILIGSIIFGLVVGVLVPIIYFFKSKPSVAVGWLILGWAVACIGSCAGVAELTHKVAQDAKEFKKEWNKSIDEASKKLDAEIEKFKKEIQAGPPKRSSQS